MRYVVALTLLVTLWLAGGVVAAQEDEPDDLPVVVDVRVNSASDEDFPVNESNFGDEILTEVLAFFEDAPIDVILRGNAPLRDRVPGWPDVGDLDFDEFDPLGASLLLRVEPVGEIDSVTISPYTGHRRPPLPVGGFGFTVGLNIGGDNETDIDTVMQAFAGIAAYSAGECAVALPYLDAALANEAAMAEGTLAEPGLAFYRAGCAYLVGDVDGAITSYQTVLAYDNEEGLEPRRLFLEPAVNLAWVYTQAGDAEAALAVLDDFEPVEYNAPFGNEVIPELARIALYAELGEVDQAFTTFDQFLTLAEAEDFEFSQGFGTIELARIYAERGLLHAGQGDPDAALADYATAIEINPEYPKVYYYRALLYEAAGDPEAALADYETFITLGEDFFWATEEDLTPYLAAARDALNDAG